MNAVVGEEGRITIPRLLLDQLGLGPGSVLELENHAGTLVGRKKPEPSVFDKWRGRGRLPVGLHNTDDYLRVIRDGHGG